MQAQNFKDLKEIGRLRQAQQQKIQEELEQKKMQEYYAKTMELMPWVAQGKNLVLPDNNKEKKGDQEKAAYW